MPVLEVAIDARKAKQGAADFNGAAASMKQGAGGVTTSMGQLQGGMDGAGRAMASAQRAVLGLFAAFGAAVSVKRAFDLIVQFESAVHKMGQTTGMQADALESLTNSIISMSQKIPVAAKELIAIGEVAGRLGIKGRQDILDFIDPIARLGVLTGEPVAGLATGLGKLVFVTGEGVKAIGPLTGVIHELEETSAASAGEIIIAAQAIARAGGVFHTSAAEAAALAAIMAQVGGRIEFAGMTIMDTMTAMQHALSVGGSELQVFTTLTGKSSAALSSMLKASPIQAFQMILDSLHKYAAAGGSVATALKLMGISSDQAMKILPALAQNSDKVAEALKRARDGMMDNATLVLPDTVANKMKEFANTIDAAVLLLKGSTGPIADTLDLLTKCVKVIFSLEGALKVATPEVKAMSAVFVVFASATTVFMAANPLGLMVLAVASLVAVLIKYKDQLEEVDKWYDRLTQKAAALEANPQLRAKYDFLGSTIFDEAPVRSEPPYPLPQKIVLPEETRLQRLQNALSLTPTRPTSSQPAMPFMPGEDRLNRLLEAFPPPVQAAPIVQTINVNYSSARPDSGLVSVGMPANVSANTPAAKAPWLGDTPDIAKQIEAAEQELKYLSLSNEERTKRLALDNALKGAKDFYKDDADGAEKATISVKHLSDALNRLEDAKKLQDVAQGVGDAFGQAFEDMVLGAKTAGEAIRGLAMDIAKLVMHQMITVPLANAITSGVYAGASAFSGWMGQPVSQIPQYRSTITEAMGGVFDRGGLHAFARGGLVSRPTLFPFAGGTGLMGEAGPEAIMPLSRGPDGRLGVAAGSARGQTSVVVNVINQTGQPVAAEQQGDVRFDGEKFVVSVVLKDLNSYGPIRRALKKDH